MAYLIFKAFDSDPFNVYVTRAALHLSDFGQLEALHREAVQMIGDRQTVELSFPFPDIVWLDDSADDVFPEQDVLFYGTDDERVASGETVAAAVQRLAVAEGLLQEDSRVEFLGAPGYRLKFRGVFGDTQVHLDTSVQNIDDLRNAANLARAVEEARFTEAVRNLPDGMRFNLVFYADENDRVFVLTEATDTAAADAAIRLVKRHYVPQPHHAAVMQTMVEALKDLDDVQDLEAAADGGFHLRVLDIRPGVPVEI